MPLIKGVAGYLLIKLFQTLYNQHVMKISLFGASTSVTKVESHDLDASESA